MFGDDALQQAAESACGEDVKASVEARLTTADDRFGKRGLLCATSNALVFVEDALLEPGEVTVVEHRDIRDLQVQRGGIFADLHVVSPHGELHFADLDKRRFDALLEAAELPSGGDRQTVTPDRDRPKAPSSATTPDGDAPKLLSSRLDAAADFDLGPANEPAEAAELTASPPPRALLETDLESEPAGNGDRTEKRAAASAPPASVADILEAPPPSARDTAREAGELDRFTERCAGCGVKVVDAYYSSHGDPLCRRCFGQEEVSISTAKAVASMQPSSSTQFDSVRAIKVVIGIFALFIYLALRTC